MTEQEIEKLKELYAELCAKARDSQRLTCQLTGEREQAKQSLVKALEDLFNTDSKYFCSKCNNPLTLTLRCDCEKYRLSCVCSYHGPLFDTEVETLFYWYNKCNEQGK